jgi:hypothetical protein
MLRRRLFNMSKEKDAAPTESVLAKSKRAVVERLGKEALAVRGNYT